jgi:hypothetical protein
VPAGRIRGADPAGLVPVRLLVGTRRGQGARPSDFSSCEVGELVMPHAHACDEPVDGPCGCRRSLVGLQTNRPTTTVEVADLPLTMDGLCAAVRASLGASGLLACIDDEEVADRWVADIAWELVQAGARFGVGTVVERRGRTLQARTGVPSEPG